MRSKNMKYLVSAIILCLEFLSVKVLSKELESREKIIVEEDFRFGYENFNPDHRQLEHWISNKKELSEAPNVFMSVCNKSKAEVGESIAFGYMTEFLCFDKCGEDGSCKKDHKCVLKIPYNLGERKCLKTCNVDDDCEYPLKCMNLPIYSNLANKYCFYEECKTEIGCEFPLKCSPTAYGYRCARRMCHSTQKCNDREKCNPVGIGCECADGMSGNNCENEAWCNDNGKFKNCKGENGTCGYISGLNVVECSCKQFPEKRIHPEENRCKKICNADSDCANGGVCEKKGENKFCSCKVGLFGDECEKVFDCTPDGKYKDCEKSGGKCSYDGSKATCECFGNKLLYDKDHLCKICDCGPHGACKFVSGQKQCDCKQGFQELNGTCTDIATSTRRSTTKSIILSTIVSSTNPVSVCNCGSFSYSCSLDSESDKLCSCFPFYSQLDGFCAECNCGPHGTCRYENGRKKCYCKSFTTEMNGVCVECNCGPFGTCRYENGQKKCNCKSFATEKNGVCVG